MSYIKIPEQVERSEFLCPMSKLLFGRIHSLSQKEGYSWATNQHFAEWYNCSPSQVTRWISELTRAGFIECEIIKKSNVRRIQIASKAISKNADTPKQKCADRISKNADTPKQKCADRISKNADTPKQKCVVSNNLIGIDLKEEYTNINTEDSGSGDVPSLAPQQSYNDFLAANNFSRLAQTTFTLTDAQQQAAKIKHGEAGYLSTLTKLDDYLEKNPSYMQGKKDFNAVFRKFADNDDLSAAKIAWNAFFTAKHGQSYTKYSKADEAALETILKHIKAKLKEGDNIGDRIAGFFNALSQLSNYNEPMKCKLTFIANDYTNIVAHLGKQREAQKQAIPTLSPADAKDAAIKGLADIGLTDGMIAFLQSSACVDLQMAKALTVSKLYNLGKFDPANSDRYAQCLKVLRPTLR